MCWAPFSWRVCGSSASSSSSYRWLLARAPRDQGSDLSALTTLPLTKLLRSAPTACRNCIINLTPFCFWDPTAEGTLVSCCVSCLQWKRLDEKSKCLWAAAAVRLPLTWPHQNQATSSLPPLLAGLQASYCKQHRNFWFHADRNQIFFPFLLKKCSSPIVDVLQVRRGIHSDYTVGIDRFSTIRGCPAIKQPSHSQQLPSSPFILRFLANTV